MKKLKLINSIMVACAAATPIAFMASCSQDNYAELAQMIKDDQKVIFTKLSRRHRATFDEQEGFQFIKDELADEKYGATPAGEDKWTDLACVIEQGNKDIPYIAKKGRRVSTSPYGNLWYDIPATKGYEDKPKIILHSHVDMTMAWAEDPQDKYFERWWQDVDDAHPEKSGGVIVDDSDYVESGYLVSDKSTSLGADNGLGVALMLSIAQHRNEFRHPGIRLLFSADESGAVPYLYSTEKIVPGGNVEDPKTIETRMLASGADLLTFDQEGTTFYELVSEPTSPSGYKWSQGVETLVTGSEKPFGEHHEFGNIISFDGSTKNTIYNSAAGIHECQISNILKNKADVNKIVDSVSASKFVGEDPELYMYNLRIWGLNGGHSGYDINEGFGNALQMLTQTLLTDDDQFRLISVDSATSAYEICNDANATFIVGKEFAGEFIKQKNEIFHEIFASSYPKEIGMHFDLTPMEVKASDPDIQCMTPERSRQVLIFSSLLLYGPNTWFDKEHKEVKSSCNFGPLTIHQQANEQISFKYNIVARSANNGELKVFQSLFHAAVGQVLYDLIDTENPDQLAHIDDLVWEPAAEGSNKLAEQIANGFNNVNIKPHTMSSHAWLEIACFPPIFADAEKAAPDMICYGPGIEHGHSILERADMNSLDVVIKAVLYVFNHADQLKSYSN